MTPKSKAPSCFKDSFVFVSFNKSGRMVTKPICMNPPAVNGNIQLVLFSEKNQVNSIQQNKFQ